MVFAARRENGDFVPHLLDATTGEITRVESEVQIIDTVFGPDDRLAGVDTSSAADQFEPVVWVTRDGRVEPIESSTGGDGFGPPRWIDDTTLIAKHARYNQAGIIASIPDVVTVGAKSGTFARVSDIPLGAWDPDPMIGSEAN